MIEEIIYQKLNKLALCPVYLEMPEKQEGDFVVFEKTGNSMVNYIDTATLAVQSYSDSLYGAATLNEKIKEAMLGLIKEPEISAVSLNSDYNFTDTNFKKYRYQAVYTVTYQEE